jgi:hypothetical protein
VRTVGVKLEAETAGYKREMAEAAKVTAEADRAAGQLGKTSETTGRKVDDLGDDFRGTGRDAQRLKDEIKSLERSLTGLAAEFAATSNAADRIDLTKAIRKQHGELRQLLKVQKLLPSDAEIKPATQSVARKLMMGLAEGAATNAARSPLITAIAAAGTAAAPVLIPALSAAVSAGVGAGLLGVGVALAAKDPLIAERGKAIGANFVAGLQQEASRAFQGPLLDSLDKFEALGIRTTQRLGKAFDSLAPSLGPLVDDLVTAGDRFGASLTNAASTSGPALHALGDSVVLISDGVADFIDTLSSGGPAAAANLRLIAGATGDLLSQTANFLNVVDRLSNNAWITGPLLPLLRKHYEDAANSGDKAAGSTRALAHAAEQFGPAVQRAVPPVASLTAGLADATREANNQRSALSALARQMRAQTDPVFALLTAEQDLKTAQANAAKAIKEHGRNSAEARTATRALAVAALDLQGRVGDLGASFTGKLTPQMIATFKAAGLTDRQIGQVAAQFRQAKKDADKYDGAYAARVSAPGAVIADKQIRSAYLKALDYDGTYQAFLKTPGGKQAENQIKKAWDNLKGYDGDWVAHVKTTGYGNVAGDLRHLLAAQQALKDGTTVQEANREMGHFFARGGPVVGPGTRTSDSIAARLSAGEHVWTADEVDAIGGQSAMLKLRSAIRSGKRVEVGDETPGFASGGPVIMPFPTTVKDTEIPQPKYAGPTGGGATYKWIEAVVRAAFPGMRVISDYRPGATTLSGNRSYHSVGRAVDFPPSKPLAEWINLHYKARTKELISPWNSLNIHNGQRHTYTGAIFRQHNFAGGNAHDHWAMANGGVINEPIFGVGASGRTYSFGENYEREHVVPERAIAAAHARGGSTKTMTLAPVFYISGVSQSPEQIAAAVDRRIGARLDYYARGV